MKGVAIIRLAEPPTHSNAPRIIESVTESVRDAGIVILAGPGWRSSDPARALTTTLVGDLKARGVDVSLGRAA